MSDVAAAEGVREVEEDHDLLTYNEAGARLIEEANRLEAVAADLAGSTEATAAAARTEAGDRAAALRQAAQRNSRLAETDTGARGFLTYRPAGRS